MQALSQSYAFWIGLFLALGILYFSPILIGAIRRVEKLWVLAGLNFIPLLWPAALIGAFMLPRRLPVRLLSHHRAGPALPERQPFLVNTERDPEWKWDI